MRKFFTPKILLIAYIISWIMYGLYVDSYYMAQKPYSYAIIVLFVFPILQFVFLILSILNSRRFYKKDKKQFIYSVIPAVVIGLIVLFVVILSCTFAGVKSKE